MAEKEQEGRIIRSKGERIFFLIVAPILILWSFTLIYPFVWTFLNSLKGVDEFYENSFNMPADWLFGNWIKAFDALKVPKSNHITYASFLEMFINSMWFTVGGVLLGMLFTSMFAYVIAKYKFKLGPILYKLSIVVMMVPIMGSMPSQYKLLYQWGFANSPLLLATGCGCIGTSLFLILYSAFKSIPWTYAEAVFIDGGSNWTAFWRVMLPQATPVLIAMGLMQFIAGWNNYMTPFMYLPDYPTMAVGLFRIQNGGSTAMLYNKPVLFAGILVTALPVLIIFMCFSKKIMGNVSMGGLKG